MRLRLAGSKQMHVVRKLQPERLLHVVGSVVVPLNDEHTNVGCLKFFQLPPQMQRRVEVRTITIEQVARDQNKLHLLSNRQSNNVVKRPPRRTAELLPRDVVVVVEIQQRAIQVDIRRVKEFEHGVHPQGSDRKRCIVVI